jgi:hypothetical protein
MRKLILIWLLALAIWPAKPVPATPSFDDLLLESHKRIQRAPRPPVQTEVAPQPEGTDPGSVLSLVMLMTTMLMALNSLRTGVRLGGHLPRRVRIRLTALSKYFAVARRSSARS